MELLHAPLASSALVVAIDPGKVTHRVWVTSAEQGLLSEPMSLPVLREGIDTLARLITATSTRARIPGPPVIAVEATGALHQAWVTELERRYPGSIRLFAPSETQAARAQLGSRWRKTDDRDCAALVWLARQGAGRPAAGHGTDALLAAVRHRRGLVADRKVAQQRLHDQLNRLCPGLSAPAGHGRTLTLEGPAGQAVLACAAAFGGQAPPSIRSLHARAPGRLTDATARFWLDRWRSCLPPPADAGLRAQRLGRDLARYQALQADITQVEAQLTRLLASTPGHARASADQSAWCCRRPRGRVRRLQPAHRPVPER